MKYKLNSKYKNFKNFILNIENYFAQNQTIIHKARNELKIINHNNTDTVVKSFKIPNIINQVVYAYFRGSKAKKSYINGIKLAKLDVNTPDAIGYIEFYKLGLLQKSFFVSRHKAYDFLIREPLYDEKFNDRENIIKQFSNFTYQLHQKNVFHKDYSAGNTLVIDKGDGEYEFSIVDINRLEFRDINISLAMQNFNKLWANESTLKIIAKEYAKISSLDETECINLILQHDKELKNFVHRRRAIKAFFKGQK